MEVDVVAAVRRAHQAWYEYATQRETLSCGIAFHSEAWPAAADLNQFREVLLGEKDVAAAWAEAEQFYRPRGLRCGRWVPSSEQPPEPLERFLADRGFTRVETTALLLTKWPEPSTAPNVRLLPVRTVRSYFQAVVAEAARALGVPEGRFAGVAHLHIDDPQLDMFVAVLGTEPAGVGGLYQVGDIALLRDLFVIPARRRTGVGRAIVSHLLALARRLTPRVICATAATGDRALASLLESCGFEPGGTLVQFHRAGEVH